MDYLQKLKVELVMSHASNGWHMKWVKAQIEKIKKRKNERSNKNS